MTKKPAFLKKGKPPMLIAPPEDSIRISEDGSWSEGSFVVGRTGITDQKKEEKEEKEDEEACRPTKFTLEQLDKQDMVGFGSSGRVYRVQNKETHEFYALKLIPMDCTKAVRIQILGEIRALSRLQHPNIVSCPDAFLVEGVLYILLEYFDCGSLGDLVKVTGPVPERICASFAKQILGALSFCHNQHYIHRDLKPCNFLVNSKGQVKIADFGTSSRLQGNASAANTWVGTVTYMSPERIQGSEYTYYSDVWSFGLTIFEIALAHYPYPPAEGADSLGFWDLLDLICQKPVPQLPKGKFSKEFCDFIAKTLEKEGSKRLTADALLKHAFLRPGNIASPSEVAKWMAPFVGKIKESISKAAEEAMSLQSGV